MNKKSGKAGTAVEPIAPVAAHEADVADPGELLEIKAEQRRTQSGKYGSTKAKPFKRAAEESSSAAAGTTGTSSTPASDNGSSIAATNGKGTTTTGASVAEEQTEKKKTSWIEIELVGEDDKPIPGEKYLVTLPDGSVDEGTLDHNGHARVEGFEPGQCKITFPELDQDAWDYVSSR